MAGLPEEAVVRQMLGMIRHRGPDQFGIYLDNRIALGSARLSIVDLGGGQQPIPNEDERFWIVYNGEIFNHHELRIRLEKRGHVFRTHSDTEVFLHLFEEEGPKCLQRLNGQFAVAIWDAKEERLFLARDRLGVRPLFYQWRNGELVFASEIKAMAVHPEISLALDPAGIGQVFTRWSCLPPQTPFRGIQQLPPGHFAFVDANGMHSESYWCASFEASTSTTTDARDMDECVDGFRALLSDSVRLRLLADVPVGAYLSGGLDSSVIAACVREFARGPFSTFSIAFTDLAFDESAAQLQVAKFLGTQHKVIETTHAEIGDVFPEVVWHAETPLLRTAPAPMYQLARLARESGYKVILTGEGADEILGGYDLFKETQIRAFCSRQPKSTRRNKLYQRIYPDLEKLGKLGAGYLAAFFSTGSTSAADPFASHALRWRNTSRCRRFFSNEFANEVRATDVLGMEDLTLPSEFAEWGSLERAQYLEMATFLSPYLLSSQGDRMAMAHGVEGRYPFLDPRVIDFCTKLPTGRKLRGLRDKRLLRKMGVGLIPDEICSRPKKPYRAPIHRSFFHGRTPDYVRELLSESKLRSAGIFSAGPVERLVQKIEAGHPIGETDDMAIAGILSTQILHSQYVDGFCRMPSLNERDDVKVCDRSIQNAPANARR
jgi:asparagine synthase (glutamine-hydrolysing)